IPGVVRELVPTFEDWGAPLAGRLASGETGSIAVTVDVPCSSTPLVAAVTPQACQRLGLASGRTVYLVWKTHACRALAAGPVSLKERSWRSGDDGRTERRGRGRGRVASARGRRASGREWRWRW